MCGRRLAAQLDVLRAHEDAVVARALALLDVLQVSSHVAAHDADAHARRGWKRVLALAAVAMALRVQSVQALWFFTSDLVFVLLVPQLTYALLDSRANLAGSVVAFGVSLILRLGGGEPLFGIPASIPYPEWAPFRTIAAAAGMVLLPAVSRLTAAWSPPQALNNVSVDS